MEDPNFTKMAIDKNQNNIHLIPPSEHEPDLPNLNEIIEDENQKQSQLMNSQSQYQTGLEYQTQNIPQPQYPSQLQNPTQPQYQPQYQYETQNQSQFPNQKLIQSQPQYQSHNQPKYQEQSQYILQNQYNQQTQVQPGYLYSPPQVNNVNYTSQINSQSENYMFNNKIQNDLELYKENEKAADKKRLKCQVFLIIFLWLILPISFFIKIKNNRIINNLDDVFIIIIGIWMIILTKRGETSRNKALGIVTLIFCIIGQIDRNYYVIHLNNIYEIIYISLIFYRLVIYIIITSYNMKCCCNK